jgi:hypothetical protein
VQGGMAVVDLINQALSSISQQSVSADASASSGQATVRAGATGRVDPGTFAAEGNAQGAAPMSSAGGPATSGGGSSFADNASPTPPTTTYSSSAGPQAHVTAPDTPRPLGQTGGSGAATGTGLPVGAARGAGVGSGPRSGSGVRSGAGRGGDTANKERGQRSGGGSGNGARPLGAAPMGAMGGMRSGGDADKEHQRKYALVEEQHDEVFEIDRVLPDELEHEPPAAEPVTENLDDEYFTNPPEITR